MLCYCGSHKLFSTCCEPFLQGRATPSTPEELMRSRYTAYCLANADYLLATTHKKTRSHHKKSDILSWSKENHWLRLQVLAAQGDYVNFKAYFIDNKGQGQVHHERSRFVNENERWYYLDGEFFE